MNKLLKVVVVGPGLDGTDVGESYSAARFVEALSHRTELTILSNTRQGRTPLEDQYPEARVITWPEPAFLQARFERFNAMAQPAVPGFFRKVRAWIATAAKAGETFDIGHQIAPQGMRYASPFRGSDLPYVVGPLGGGLATPPGFAHEVTDGALVRRLRALDGWRLRHDPALRRGYMDASLIIGVAPYIGETLRAAMPVKRFEVVLERAHAGLEDVIERPKIPGQLKLAHVGRGIRTKGLRDVIRALAQLGDMPGITLTSAGDGPDMAACRAEAEALGVADRVRFLGRIPREDVDQVMREADVFAFPSFREPMGGVLFEALSWGLPIVTAARGGPAYIVDESCGIRLPATTPDQLARDLAVTFRDLAGNPDTRTALEAGARARLMSFGTWDEKAARMVGLYHEILGTT